MTAAILTTYKLHPMERLSTMWLVVFCYVYVHKMISKVKFYFNPLLTCVYISLLQSCGLLYGTESLEVRVPSPWAIGRTIETIHPVRDNYKFKETVTFPGAKNLFLKFDARCSSQYDYDKVVVYAGENASSPKVAEYGGNTHGFGSRSVLGKGWPKDLVKVYV